jgi:hypothetical protein
MKTAFSRDRALSGARRKAGSLAYPLKNNVLIGRHVTKEVGQRVLLMAQSLLIRGGRTTLSHEAESRV